MKKGKKGANKTLITIAAKVTVCAGILHDGCAGARNQLPISFLRKHRRFRIVRLKQLQQPIRYSVRYVSKLPRNDRLPIRPWPWLYQQPISKHKQRTKLPSKIVPGKRVHRLGARCWQTSFMANPTNAGCAPPRQPKEKKKIHRLKSNVAAREVTGAVSISPQPLQ